MYNRCSPYKKQHIVWYVLFVYFGRKFSFTLSQWECFLLLTKPYSRGSHVDIMIEHWTNIKMHFGSMTQSLHFCDRNIPLMLGAMHFISLSSFQLYAFCFIEDVKMTFLIWCESERACSHAWHQPRQLKRKGLLLTKYIIKAIWGKETKSWL